MKGNSSGNAVSPDRSKSRLIDIRPGLGRP
jgi:hypothetical protein